MNKTILVTGANRGIGLELVKQNAQAGCTVLACCRDPNNATDLQNLSQSFKSISIFQLDVNNEDHIKQLAKKLNNISIDILFNNAGIAGDDSPFGKVTHENLMSTLNINTIGPVLLAQALYKQVAQSQNKMIVNTSSLLGSIELDQDSSWFWLSYRISKSALNAASRCLANQLKSKGIIIIALDPGWVKTDMGGSNATLTKEESVKGIMKTLANITINDSGKFIRYNGEFVPW